MLPIHIHTIEPVTTTVISGPQRCNCSYGRWAVRVRDSRPSGAVIEYSHTFWRKREALAWITQQQDK